MEDLEKLHEEALEDDQFRNKHPESVRLFGFPPETMEEFSAVDYICIEDEVDELS